MEVTGVDAVASTASSNGSIPRPTLCEQKELSIEEQMLKSGVPTAPALENIDKYLKENGLTIEEASNKIQENFRKYKLLEANIMQQKGRIQENILDYRKSLAALEVLANSKRTKKSSVEFTYKLDENIYSKCDVDNFEKVCLWLGANIMAEYELDDAQKLIVGNLANIEKMDVNLAEQLDFLRDQITTSEVNVAHLYNYGVQHAKSKEVDQKKTKNGE